MTQVKHRGENENHLNKSVKETRNYENEITELQIIHC